MREARQGKVSGVSGEWPMTRRSKRIIGWLAALSLALPACVRKADPKASKTDASTGSSKPALPARVDKKLLQELGALAKACDVNPKAGKVSCKGKEHQALLDSFRRNRRNRLEALPTLAFALASKDARLPAVAAAVLYGAFRNTLGRNVKPGAVPAADAKAMLNTVSSLPQPLARQVMPTAVHMAMVSGQSAGLYPMLSQDRPLALRTMAYRHLMRYGRLEAFGKVKELSQSDQTPIVLAAIESPRHMQRWTKAEQEVICPWARGFVSDPRAPIARNATALLSRCSGKDLDLLLSEASKALKDKSISVLHVSALRDLCSAVRTRRGDAASEPQCRRLRKLLGAVVKEKAIRERTRAFALSAMAYQWPDAATLELAKKFEDAEEAPLRQSARRVFKRLERRLASGKQHRAAAPPRVAQRPSQSQAAAARPAQPAAPAKKPKDTP